MDGTIALLKLLLLLLPKVYIPSENCSVLLAISSIRTPNPARAGGGDGKKTQAYAGSIVAGT